MPAARASTSDSRPVPEVAAFRRVVVGIDGSPESHDAARQAVVLAAPDADLELVSVYSLAPPIIGATGGNVPLYYDEEAQRSTAADTVAAAAAALGRDDVGTKIELGTPWEVLLDELGDAPGGLLAVASHGTGRIEGIVMGSTATEVIHKARASVLVARPAGENFPRKIVVGVDGSAESAVAYAVARSLADRFGAKLWPAIAHGGDHVDTAAVAQIVGTYHDDMPDEPATALVAAAAEADLLVVGSRGLHGLKSLGSVSERVAHEARSSVLIVRNVEAA